MSVPQTIEEIRMLARKAVRATYLTIKELLKRNDDKNTKRAALLSYWIKDYCNYTLQEDSFDPKQLVRYKRGNIVLVEFGYRVGRELGGRHYAVVIDNYNGLSSDVVTVVPLRSYKDNYKSNKHSFILEKGLYNLYEEKMIRKINEIEDKANKVLDVFSEKQKEYENGNIPTDEFKKAYKKVQKAQKEFRIEQAQLRRQIKTLSKLRNGTIVDVGQITTISKMRIVNPKIYSDSLYGLKLKPSDLDVLNRKLSELFIKNKNNS